MICKLCHKPFLGSQTILGIFQFTHVCEDCKSIYQPTLNHEMIPIHLGELHYYYLFQFEYLPKHIELYLSQYLSIFYQLLQKEDFDLVLYLDDDIYYSWTEIAYLMKDYCRVIFISLARKELIYKEIF